jgi:hypothetical protein
MGQAKNAEKFPVGNSEMHRPLERIMSKWKYNSKMNFKEIVGGR